LVDAQGLWSIPLTAEEAAQLGDGSETVTARQTLAGSTSDAAVRSFQVDLPAPPQEFTITAGAASIYEGDPLSIQVSTTNVEAGTPLYWQFAGPAITASDFSDGQLGGSGTIGADGRLAFSRTIAADGISEGEEALELRFYTDAARSRQVGPTTLLTIQEAMVGSPTDGNDIITGTAAADTISGVPLNPPSSLRGRGTIDELTGGASADRFVLGDEVSPFYDDGNGLSQGRADFGVITDFETGDRIQLHGDAEVYLLGRGTFRGLAGTFIYSRNPDRPLSPRPSFYDEVIGFVQGLDPSQLNLGSEDQFSYVGLS
jgi:hypothetical protein